MIDKNTANAVLDTALSKGGRFAEIFIEENLKNSVSLVNGSIDKSISGIDFGLGLRIFFGDKVIYTYTNDLSYDNLMKCAAEAASAFCGSTKFSVKDFCVYNTAEYDIHKPRILPSENLKTEVVDMLKGINAAAFSYDSLITQTSISYMDSVQNVTIINSDGLWADDRRVRTRLSINAVASNETEKQNGYIAPGAMMGMEFYEGIDTQELAREAARSAITILNAKPAPAGRMDVVLDNGFGGVIFHEACGHGLEAASIAKGASVFAGKLGEKIANSKVTAIDDGTIPHSWGSINIDDEGHKAQKNILIENGILKNYMVDRFNGEKMGMPATGSSRRQSYKFIPVSRMTNTYIAAGNEKKADIIANTEYGLYAKYMGGGSVNPVNGEFNFAVNEAYLIRNGKIAEPVRGATLIGKGAEVLMKIDMVSDDLKLAEGMCGASSGSVPVDVGQPMLRVRDITVGGRI